MPYDIFLSYARKDNEARDPGPDGTPEGWVTALHRHILEDHRRFSTEELRIFFDIDAIADMDDWRHRILGGLRDSRILLVCLSPNYLASEYCRWELEEYQRRQVHQLMGSDSVASVYFVEPPGGTDAERARLLDELMRGNFTDIRPWFPAGPRALREAEVQRRLAALGQSLWVRLERARRALAVPGNLRRQNPHFVGRREELRRLHEQASLGSVGMVTAVQGLGGMGKTELAVAYAHAFADCYPGGLWILPAEGKCELLPLIGRLAYEPALGYPLRPEDKDDPQRLGRAVLTHLRERALAAGSPDRTGRALLLLDNVSEAGLLSPAQLATLPGGMGAGWLATIATTRLDLKERKQQLALVTIDALDEDSALALVREHQHLRNMKGEAEATHGTPRFADAAEEEAARSIVRLLGGFTLAVEQVAVYLGLHPEVPPSRFLTSLQDRGVALADSLPERDEEVAAGMLAAHKQLGLILDQTLAQLDAPTRAALEYASLLQPDHVPWPILQGLVLQRFPELRNLDELGADPWLTIKRRLHGLRLLTHGDRSELARMHRLVAAHFSTQANKDAYVAVREALVYLITTMSTLAGPPEYWEIDGVMAALELRLERSATHDELASLAPMFCRHVADQRPLSWRRRLLNLAMSSWPTDQSEATAELYSQLGELDFASGKADEAKRNWRHALEIRKRLAITGNESWERDLAHGHRQLGDLAKWHEDLNDAEAHYKESVAILTGLLNPSSYPEWQYELAQSHNRLGQLALVRGNLALAACEHGRALELCTTLVEMNLYERSWESELGNSYRLLGDLAVTCEDLEGARRSYEAAFAIMERLAVAYPSIFEYQSGLSAIHSGLGNAAKVAGNLHEGKEHFLAARQILEFLTASDPENVHWQWDLAMTNDRLGNLALDAGDHAEAKKCYRAAMVIAGKLVVLDPSNLMWSQAHYRYRQMGSTSWDEVGRQPGAVESK